MRLIAGFLLAALCCGCSTTSVFETDKAHPSLEMDGNQVKCNGEVVSPYDVPKILEKHGVSHDTRIHIRINQLELEHAQAAHLFRHILARAGYSKTSLVTKQHADAWSQKSIDSQSPVNDPQAKPRVRYRSANEK